MPLSCTVSSQNTALHFNIDRCDLAKSETISLFSLQTICVHSVKENLSEDSVQKNDSAELVLRLLLFANFTLLQRSRRISSSDRILSPPLNPHKFVSRTFNNQET